MTHERGLHHCLTSRVSGSRCRVRVEVLPGAGRPVGQHHLLALLHLDGTGDGVTWRRRGDAQGHAQGESRLPVTWARSVLVFGALRGYDCFRTNGEFFGARELRALNRVFPGADQAARSDFGSNGRVRCDMPQCSAHSAVSVRVTVPCAPDRSTAGQLSGMGAPGSQQIAKALGRAGHLLKARQTNAFLVPQSDVSQRDFVQSVVWTRLQQFADPCSRPADVGTFCAAR